MKLKIEIDIKDGSACSDNTLSMLEELFEEIVEDVERRGKIEGRLNRDGEHVGEWSFQENGEEEG